MLCALCGSVVNNRAGETSVRSSGPKHVKRTQLGGTDNRRARPALQDAQRAAGGAGQAPVAGFGSRKHQTNPICSVFGLRMGSM